MEYDDFNIREECNKLLKECENRLKITKDEEEIKRIRVIQCLIADNSRLRFIIDMMRSVKNN